MIRNYKVEKIVIGYPVRLDGSEGIQCEKVNRFAATAGGNFFLPVVKWPETLSTKEAEEILINSGVRWEKRKKMVDKLAACLILQSYLDSPLNSLIINSAKNMNKSDKKNIIKQKKTI